MVLAFNTSENAEISSDYPALEYKPHAIEGKIIYALLVGPVEDFWISESKIPRIQQGLALRRSKGVPDVYEYISALVVDSDENAFVNAAIATIGIL